MSKNNNYSLLKKFSLGQGVDLFGVADSTQLKKEIALSEQAVKKMSAAISLGVALSAGILEEISQSPTRLYFHHYKAANTFLDQVAFKVGHYIQKQGYRSIAIPASVIVDWVTQKAHLSHKHSARLAGLGWIGRNNLLVNKKLGSQFRLATILTDMPLTFDKPTKERCGSCRACVQVCPAGAIQEDPQAFDHQKCFEKLKEFQKQRLVDQYICGVCVNACKGSR